MRSSLSALLLLAFAVVFLSAGCDTGGGDDEADDEALFRVEATDAQGDPVEGLRVGVRPCFTESCAPRDAFFSRTDAPAATQSVDLEGTLMTAVEGRDVILTWETSSEKNNRGFRVLRRVEGEEAFAQIGFVESKAAGGTTGGTLSYSYRDADAPLGTSTYQLTQVDLDGTATPYEDDRATTMVAITGEFALAGPYPNPFMSRTTFRLAVRETQSVTTTLQNLTGARVATLFDGPLDAGQTVHLSYEPADDTPDGIYRAVFEGETFADTARLAVVVRTRDHVYQRIGTTGRAGTVATDERGYFPSLLDLPRLARRNPQNEHLGTFRPSGIVEIALTDPATGTRRTYRRTVRDGANTFALTWNP